MTIPTAIAETAINQPGAIRGNEAEHTELSELRRRDALVQHQAHDLANLLVAMSSRLEVLKTLESKESRDEEIARIQRVVSMAAKILTTIRTGKEKMEKTPCDLVSVIHDIAYALSNHSSHNIKMTVIPTEPILAEVDINDFWRMMHNLLRNPIEAIAEQISRGERLNGGEIQIRVMPSDGDLISIEVEDNGPGIPAEILKNLFQDGVTTKSGPGHGFGLANVADIVAAHGGIISVSSQPGKTTFSIVIPQGNIQREESAGEKPLNDQELLRDRVVILVEDDIFVAEFVTETFVKGFGANNIVTCNTYHELEKAVPNIDKNSPWVVVLDGTFPGGKPHQVVALIKGLKPDAQIIFHSGGTHEEPNGIDKSLNKPVTLEQWRTALRDLFAVNGVFGLKQELPQA